MLAAQFLPAPSSVTAQGTVTMSLIPAAQTVNVGDTFTLDINVNAGAQQVDGASAFVNFDATKFQVVDQNANTAGVQITPGTAMDTVFTNCAGNVNGAPC